MTALNGGNRIAPVNIRNRIMERNPARMLPPGRWRKQETGPIRESPGNAPAGFTMRF